MILQLSYQVQNNAQALAVTSRLHGTIFTVDLQDLQFLVRVTLIDLQNNNIMRVWLHITTHISDTRLRSIREYVANTVRQTVTCMITNLLDIYTPCIFYTLSLDL